MKNIMPIENIPDWEKRLARHDAFWDCEIIDRPVVFMQVSKKKPVMPYPDSAKLSSIRERWMDAQLVADSALAFVSNTDFLADALPNAWPNLGPDLFCGFLGCELEFAETTSWSSPILSSLGDGNRLHFSENNFYYRKLVDMTNALLEAGKGKFYVGYTDFHPGGDAIAALRGPTQLNYDLLEQPDAVKELRKKVDRIYFGTFDLMYNRLQKAGQLCATWCNIVSSKKWTIACNDFSCMISKKMFDDIFLPGIIGECRFFEKSIYHLDGPGALQHLDSLLDIKELNAIQWVPGEGHGRASDWMHIYKRIQQAGKGMQISLGVDEIDFFMENLRPEGLWLGLYGIDSADTAKSILKRIRQWR